MTCWTSWLTCTRHSFIYLVRVVTEVKLSYESVIHEPITRVMLISGLDIVKIKSKSASYTSHCHAIRYSAIWWSVLYRYSTLCVSIFADLCTKDTPIWKGPLSQTHKLIVPWKKMIGILKCNQQYPMHLPLWYVLPLEMYRYVPWASLINNFGVGSANGAVYCHWAPSNCQI